MTSRGSKTTAAPKDRWQPNRPDPAEPTRPGSMAHFAHALKTPINHIIGYCDLLQEEGGDGGLGG